MTLTPQTVRLDKKCGSSGIPDNAKCSKKTTSPAKAKYEPTFGDRLNAGINTAASIYTGGVGLLNLGMAAQHRSAGHAISGVGQLLGAGVGLKGASEYMKGRKLSGDLYTLGGAGLAMGGEAVGNAVAESDFRRRQANAVANKSGYTGKDPFKDLGVSSEASSAEIRKAYMQMAAKNHPDLGGNQEEFQRLKSAYDEILRRRGQARGTRDSIWASGFVP